MTVNVGIDFDPLAAHYDRCNHLFSFGIHHYWRKRVVRALAPQGSECVLDVCTGTGDLAFMFLRYSGVQKVSGLDVSGAMLALAQKKQHRLGFRPWLAGRPIDWHEADAAHTGLAAAGFDCLSCAFGIRNIPDRAGTLSEMHRLLKAGGRLGILEFSLPANPLLRGLYGVYLRRVMPGLGALVLGSKEALRYLADSVYHWHTEVDFAGELTQSGFTQIRRIPLTGGIVTLWLAQRDNS